MGTFPSNALYCVADLGPGAGERRRIVEKKFKLTGVINGIVVRKW